MNSLKLEIKVSAVFLVTTCWMLLIPFTALAQCPGGYSLWQTCTGYTSALGSGEDCQAAIDDAQDKVDDDLEDADTCCETEAYLNSTTHYLATSAKFILVSGETPPPCQAEVGQHYYCCLRD